MTDDSAAFVITNEAISLIVALDEAVVWISGACVTSTYGILLPMHTSSRERGTVIHVECMRVEEASCHASPSVNT